jgi:hypothetical protein
LLLLLLLLLVLVVKDEPSAITSTESAVVAQATPCDAWSTCAAAARPPGSLFA